MLVELLDGRIDTTTTNGVHWGARSALVTALSHFPELTEDQVDALWTWVRVASDLLASCVPPLVAYNPPNSVGSSGSGSLCCLPFAL
jgi:hypothetical protein